MTLNEHVNCNKNILGLYEFTPDEGYALWKDNEPGNLDENGEPIHYSLRMIMNKTNAESTTPHIWSRLIEDGMQVY